MANTTARTAKHIHGTNPQFLVEKVIRARIYDSPYWKEHCFALTAESLVDRAARLDSIGGTYGLQRPTQFLCLVLKLLQLQPDREIILEYLRYPDLKYLRAVAAMYVRLTFRAYDVFDILEPMMKDYRKLRVRQMNGEYGMSYMDDFIDELLSQERSCELILPRLTRRDVLEETEGLAPRMSVLQVSLSNGNEHDGEAVADNADELASDDSERERGKEHRRRVERARRIRQERMAGEERRKRLREIHTAVEKAASPSSSSDEDYPSQEESDADRFVSRSPSQAGSPGYVSRSPSQSPDRAVMKSRSASMSPGSDGYKSRSISVSPDRT